MIERLFVRQELKKLKLEEYLRNELRRAGFTGVEVIKTPITTRIIVSVTRPGLAIGKKGKTIKILTKEISERFGFENPQIEINEVKKPELDAKACVDRMVALIERGYSWRSVVYRTIEDIMASGAQGAEIVLKGVLAGKGNRKRKERIAKGYMKKAGEQAYLVDYAKGVAVPKPGAIGIKVRIIKPEVVFPDKISIEKFLEQSAAEKAEEKEVSERKEEETQKEEPSKQEVGKEKQVESSKELAKEKVGEHEEIQSEKKGAKVGGKKGEAKEKTKEKKKVEKPVKEKKESKGKGKQREKTKKGGKK
ncbi:MAG: 30S ribosomal protein S3 [Candidatus Diapherotrites archaeon]|nr:30S ribosomal protein S3 [Candidatus Diapherotrites archaeon]